MKRKLLTLVIALMAGAGFCSAQSRGALRINEVMVQNDSNFVDDYGCYSAWIELFNSNFAPLEISSVFITDDPDNPTKYPVPLGDVNTRMPKRQHVLFWADGQETRGTFHLNFRLVPGQENYVAVYDADGKTLIDEVTIPADLAPNTSYARTEDGASTWEVRDGSTPDLYVTPSSANRIKGTNPKIQNFKEIDENGIGMTVMAMCIVFSALLLLCLCFYVISRIGASRNRTRKMEAAGVDVKSTPRTERPDHDSGEVIAAIAMALNEHINVHDRESTILTINKVKRAYSPWNSKIYGMRHMPGK
ncbi:MAG: OadG family protein [Muribaculaceae bacterium]|nr:OadG family protein [Muribaculaceae bacterium]